MSAENSITDNRRGSFRLEDEVILRVRVLDDEACQAILAEFDAFRLRYCMKSHIHNQINVRKPQLARIRNGKADVAEYLSALEDQIVLLAERLDKISNTSDDGEERKCQATLSTTGIRFQTEAQLAAGQNIELGLLLSTVNTQVVTIGKVINVEVQADGLTNASVVFSNIHLEDVDVIACHLANLQRQELQARREQEED